MNRLTFYNRYHKKNSAYHKLIVRRNFTYFYILQFLHRPDLKSAVRREILDVGCGVGTLSLYLSQFGQNITGIDVSSRAIKIARHAARANRAINLRYLIQPLSVNKKKYDLILATEVMEHIQDDKKFLHNIYLSLKPGGYLLLSTPSKSSLMYQWGWYARFDRAVGHVRRYDMITLKKNFKAHGFRIITMAERESLLRSILFTTRLGLLIKFIRGPLVNLFHFCDEQLGRIFGFTDLIILAKKPL